MDGSKPKQRKFAVFDIDGTIARTSLLQLMSRELVARGLLTISVGHEIDMRLHDYRQKVSDESFGKYMADAVTIMFDNLKQLPVEEYVAVAEAIVNRSLSNTYVYTRELINNLRKHGYFLIAISGSELRIVNLYTKALGFDVAIGEVSYKGDKVLTGEVEMLKHPKSDILKALIAKYDLQMADSMAVGDTSSDISMLEMVAQPIAFNPNQALFQAAKQRAWLVVIERKDMVYALEPKDGTFVLASTNA